MEPVGSLPRSQDLTTTPYTESVQSRSHSQTLFLQHACYNSGKREPEGKPRHVRGNIKSDFKGVMWTGFIWLKTESSGGLL
jgi:hypothetical protein